jgi:hypothetical protein
LPHFKGRQFGDNFRGVAKAANATFETCIFEEKSGMLSRLNIEDTFHDMRSLSGATERKFFCKK